MRKRRRQAIWACLIWGSSGLVASAQTPREERAVAIPEINLGPPVTTTAEAEQRPVVMDVQIRGQKQVSLSKIQSYLRTRKGRELDAELLQGDVRRLTHSGLFRDVRTLTQDVDGGVVVVFEVFERPVIGEVLFIGNRGIRDKVLLKQSDLKKGEALNQFSVEEGRRKIEEFYRTKGFPKTQITVLEGDKPTDERIVYLVDEGQLERINSVSFVGNSIASDDRLKTQIQSKPGFLWYFFGGKVDRQKIDEDIERLTAYYRSLGFFRARIGRELEFDESGRWLDLRYVIDEGPRYVVRNVTVAGNEKFSNQQLMDELGLKSGKYFNQGEMNRDITVLRDKYGAEGHVYVDVQADARFLEEPGQLDLIYRIKEGDVFRVGHINVKIDGEFPHTRQSVVMNRISLRPGDILDIREVRRSEQRLKSSQLFETDPTKGQPPQLTVVPPDGVSQASAVSERPRSGSGVGPSANRGGNGNRKVN
jgi:outer membrane protein insertion porin family